MHTLAAQPTGVSAISRVMSDPEWQPTREQVASLIDLLLNSTARDDSDLVWRAAYEAGYRARVAEENALYPPPKHNLLYRETVPVDTAPRPDDYRGGPVEVWD